MGERYSKTKKSKTKKDKSPKQGRFFLYKNMSEFRKPTPEELKNEKRKSLITAWSGLIRASMADPKFSSLSKAPSTLVLADLADKPQDEELDGSTAAMDSAQERVIWMAKQYRLEAKPKDIYEELQSRVVSKEEIAEFKEYQRKKEQDREYQALLERRRQNRPPEQKKPVVTHKNFNIPENCHACKDMTCPSVNTSLTTQERKEQEKPCMQPIVLRDNLTVKISEINGITTRIFTKKDHKGNNTNTV